jgi:uncharacterized protein (DUF1778 family)
MQAEKEVRINFRISEDNKKEIQEYCNRQGVTVSLFMIRAAKTAMSEGNWLKVVD